MKLLRSFKQSNNRHAAISVSRLAKVAQRETFRVIRARAEIGGNPVEFFTFDHSRFRLNRPPANIKSKDFNLSPGAARIPLPLSFK